MNPARESIRKRYVVTLLSKSIQMVLGIVKASFVPRALGPAAYGSFNFLLASATNFRSAADLGAQQMVYTLSSKSEKTGALTKLYGLWLLTQAAGLFGLIGVCALLGKTNWLWPHQKLDQIVWVTLLEWLLFTTARVAQLGDSKGLTIKTQRIAALCSLVTAFLLVGLAAWRQLDFYNYVAVLLATTVINALIYITYLFGRHRAQLWDEPLRGRVRPYLNQWWTYSSPIVVSNLYGAIMAWFDVYLIQRLYGSTEQGYFALSSALSNGVLIFTASSISIYWREIAHCLGKQDRARAASIHLLFSRLLFFLTFSLSIWLCFNASFIVSLAAGRAYQASIPILMIMAFFPLQQTHGQINHSVLFASENTVHYRNLDIALSLPGLAVSYFLLASPAARIPGLGLGAMGIAMKVVIYGLVSVQLYEYWVCRILGISYPRLLLQKILTTLFVGSIAWALLVGLPKWFPFDGRFYGIPNVGAASLIYFSTLLALIYRWPALCGLNREHIESAMGSLRGYIRRL